MERKGKIVVSILALSNLDSIWCLEIGIIS
jgi:hypothetical protein